MFWLFIFINKNYEVNERKKVLQEIVVSWSKYRWVVMHSFHPVMYSFHPESLFLLQLAVVKAAKHTSHMDGWLFQGQADVMAVLHTRKRIIREPSKMARVFVLYRFIRKRSPFRIHWIALQDYQHTEQNCNWLHTVENAFSSINWLKDYDCRLFRLYMSFSIV